MLDGKMDVSTTRDQHFIGRLGRDIDLIGTYLEELGHNWAKALGVSDPQWRIILVLADSDNREGVPVKVVSRMLNVDPSFITTQSKLLEKKGLIQRKASSEDGRIVNMSLTDGAAAHLADLAAQQGALSEYIFADFEPRELEDLTSKLSSLKTKLKKACLKLAANL
jgi:DNA-binding MarR family transcriptional regulator